MSYTPPAHTDAGGSLSTGYTPPAYTDAGGAVGVSVAGATQVVTVVQLRVRSTTYYFSDREYGDANTRWHDCRLVGDIAYSRGGECVLHGRARGGTGGLGNIELINVDGALDGLATGPQDDAEVRVWRVQQHQSMAAALPIAAALVTDLEGRGEDTLRVVTGDLRALLRLPLQADLYEEGEAVAAQAGRPRPTAIGQPKSCPIVLVDDVDYEYDGQDSAAFEVSLVRDSGVVLGVGTEPGDGYRIADPPVYGIELLQMPVGRVVADINATAAAAESIIGSAEGDFGSDLDDWEVIEDTTGGGTAGATWDSGAALLEASKVGNPGGIGVFARLRFPALLVAGQRYAWSMDVDVECDHVDGHELLQIFFEPASGAAGEHVTLAQVYATTADSLSGEFSAPSAGRLVISAGAASFDGVEGAITASIDTVRLARIAAGGTVADVVEHLLAKAGISADRIDAASIAALRVARPWNVSYWYDSAVTIEVVLEDVLDSVYGWHYLTPDNRIAVGFLRPPEESDASVLTITEAMLDGGIEVVADLAPGLSTTVCGRRNWYRYGPGEFADSVSDADRAMLSADYRIRCTSTNPVGIDLGRRQGAAVSSDSEAGIATLLDDEEHIQAAADYLSELYPAGVPRKWYRVPTLIEDGAAAALRPGQKIILQRNRFGCAAGRPLRFLKIDARVGDGVCVLRAWGAGDV